MPKCSCPGLDCSGGALTVLTSGFFSGELFSLFCCCWPELLNPCARGDVTLPLDTADCPFFMSGEVIGKLKELWSCLCVSREALFEFDVCSLAPCHVCVLVEESAVAEIDPSLSARGLNVDDFSEPTDLLVDETGIELLLDSHLMPGDDDLKEETEDDLVFEAISSVFVLIGSSWVPLFPEAIPDCSLWEVLRFSAQAVRSKVVCPKEKSAVEDASVFFKYLLMSKALCSPTQWLLCSVSNKVPWCGPLWI